MEKTIELSHGDFKAMVPSPERFFVEHDFGVEEFERVVRDASPLWRAYKAALFDEYSTLGFPAWKRSKLARLELPTLEPGVGIEIEEAAGVNVVKLEESREALEIVKVTDFEGSDRKFALQSTVFNSSGIFVKSEDERGMITLKVRERGKKALVFHNVFLVRKGEKLKVVNLLEGAFYASVLNRYVVEEGGELFVLNLRFNNTFGFTNELYKLSSQAKVTVYNVDKPQDLHAPFLMALLDSEGAKCTFKSGFTALGTSMMDAMYVLRHRAAETRGKVEGSGVLFDAAGSVFRGNIEIAKGAVNTETGESVNVVLLSPQARADSIPALFVEENEVTASHAATVGALKEEGLYYLMSRGLDETAAVRLVVGGIFEPMLQEIEDIFGNKWQEVAGNVLTGAST